MNLARWLVVLGLTAPAWAQYAGPAILARGEAPTGMNAPQISFSPSLVLSGVYTNGLAGVSVENAQGGLRKSSSFGEAATLSLTGTHSWKHTTLGLNYSGTFNRYDQASYYDSINQSLSLSLTHQFTRHLMGSVRESAGLFSMLPINIAALSSTVASDPSQSYIPTTDFYNNRTVYQSTQGSLTLQKSTRLSFNFGGGYFVTKYRSSALYGNAGESATGDVQYRVSRRTTVGANYSFGRFTYSHIFGDAITQSAALSLAVGLSRHLEFSGYAGFSRMETKFIQAVAVDPALAALLGITQGTVVSHQIAYFPNFSARLARTFEKGVLYASGSEGVLPGNGLFLASKATSATVGYGYNGFRNWSVNVAASYVDASSYGNITGNYGNYSGTLGVSREIVRHVSLVSSLYAIKYRSTSYTNYNRVIYTASVGIGFAPGSVPVRLW